MMEESDAKLCSRLFKYLRQQEKFGSKLSRAELKLWVSEEEEEDDGEKGGWVGRWGEEKDEEEEEEEEDVCSDFLRRGGL